MSLDPRIEEALERHPCYNEKAHTRFARMHIPVAPRCNIQCNYCNRKYDCSNESRPGVTSEVLTPQQAVDKIRIVKEKIPELSVIGIAGPGDPLANEETFMALELIGKEFPDLTLCISTNGLALPECARRLYDLGVRFVTVTMNAPDAETGARIYDSVLLDGRRLTGIEGAAKLLERQTEGIRMCADLGMAVKVNIVMVPGINDAVIPDLVKEVKGLGAYIVNILPLIPVEGTRFADLRAPTPLERRRLMDRCELDAKMMRHCRQCRADAIGLLGEDRSQEFVHAGCALGNGCGSMSTDVITPEVNDPERIAIASDADGNVCGFGSASEMRIYERGKSGARLVSVIPVDRSGPVAGGSHRRHIMDILSGIRGCGSVVVTEVGEMPSRMLKDFGISVVRMSGTADGAAGDLLHGNGSAIGSAVGQPGACREA